MSGSIFAPWSRVREPLASAMQLAAHFNCTAASAASGSSASGETTSDVHDHEAIATCLQKIPAEQIVAAKVTVPTFQHAFGPSFDGVTIKNNFADIKGKRSFGTRYELEQGECFCLFK
jgi:hypothetical protein